MPRIRGIKPDFFLDEKLSELPFSDRLADRLIERAKEIAEAYNYSIAERGVIDRALFWAAGLGAGQKESLDGKRGFGNPLTNESNRQKARDYEICRTCPSRPKAAI